MLDRVKRKRNRATCEAINASDVLTVGRHVYTPTKCTRTLCIRPAAVACLMCQKLRSLPSPFALRSFQGNMCAGILPQLRQGLARSTVGTERVWENRGSVPLSFPHRHSASFSLALVHQAASLPCLSHPYCNSSSSLFSPYIPQLSHFIPYTVCLFAAHCLSLPSKNHFFIVPPLIFLITHTDPLYFLFFSFSFPPIS